MVSRILGSYPFRIQVVSSAALFTPLGTEIALVGTSDIDMVVDLGLATGDAQCLAAVQLAATQMSRPDAPTAATGSYTGTTGAHRQPYDASGDTTKLSAVAGLLSKLSSTTPGILEGTLNVVVKSTGAPVGAIAIQASPEANTSNPSYHLIGGWIPRLGATNLRAVILGTEVADLSWRLFARLANDTDNPTAMEGLGTDYTDFSPTGGVVELNTGNLSVTGLTDFSDYQLIQFILALKMTSSGTAPGGFFRVTAGLAYG